MDTMAISEWTPDTIQTDPTRTTPDNPPPMAIRLETVKDTTVNLQPLIPALNQHDTPDLPPIPKHKLHPEPPSHTTHPAVILTITHTTQQLHGYTMCAHKPHHQNMAQTHFAYLQPQHRNTHQHCHSVNGHHANQ